MFRVHVKVSMQCCVSIWTRCLDYSGELIGGGIEFFGTEGRKGTKLLLSHLEMTARSELERPLASNLVV